MPDDKEKTKPRSPNQKSIEQLREKIRNLDGEIEKSREELKKLESVLDRFKTRKPKRKS